MKKNAIMEVLRAFKKFDKDVYKTTNGYSLDYETYGRLLDYILEPTPHRYDDIIEHLGSILNRELEKDELNEVLDEFLVFSRALKRII